MATGTYTADTRSTVFLLMSLPSLVSAAVTLRPTMALETPPMVVAMLHHDRKVRSFAAQQKNNSSNKSGMGKVNQGTKYK